MTTALDAAKNPNSILPDAAPFNFSDTTTPQGEINQYQIHAIVHLDVAEERANQMVTRILQQQVSRSLVSASDSLTNLRTSIRAAERNLDTILLPAPSSGWENLLLKIGAILAILGLIFLYIGI